MRNWMDMIKEVAVADEDWGGDWVGIEDGMLARYCLGAIGDDDDEQLMVWGSDRTLNSGIELYLKNDEDKLLSYLGLVGCGEPDALQVSGAITNPDEIRQGYASMLYRWVLQYKDIVSDDSQTQGGKAIWKRMFRDGIKITLYPSGEPVSDIEAYFADHFADQLRASLKG
jgi:hypothetical protein